MTRSVCRGPEFGDEQTSLRVFPLPQADPDHRTVVKNLSCISSQDPRMAVSVRHEILGICVSKPPPRADTQPTHCLIHPR